MEEDSLELSADFDERRCSGGRLLTEAMLDPMNNEALRSARCRAVPAALAHTTASGPSR